MASTYTSDKVAATVPVRSVVAEPVTVVAKYTIAAALVVNDVVQMVKVPAGAIVLDAWVIMPDVDTGGSPAATFTLGDGVDPDRYITSTAAGTAATFTRMNAVAAGVSTSPYAAEDTVDIKFDTAPATSVTAGDIYCSVTYQRQR